MIIDMGHFLSHGLRLKVGSRSRGEWSCFGIVREGVSHFALPYINIAEVGKNHNMKFQFYQILMK